MVRVRRQLGLRGRATVAWGLLALVLAASLAVAAHEITRAELVSDREDRAMSQAFVNARLLRSGLRAPAAPVGELLGSLEGNAGSTSLALVDGEWVVGSVGTDPAAVPVDLRATVDGGRAARQVVRVGDRPVVAIGVPVAEHGVGYYELVPLDDVETTLSVLARNLAVTAVVVAVVGAAAGWWVSGRVLVPLRRTATAATSIAGGDLDARLRPTTDPDLRPLHQAFDDMADAVQERIAREHRFTSDVSHELRAPLAAMLSAIDLARRHEDDPAALRDALDALQERAEAFHELVVDLLEISRVDAGVAELAAEPIEPEALARAVLATLGRDDVPVEVDPGAPVWVMADKRRVGRMLMNLVENADRYGGGATRIVVSGDGDRVRFAVDDDGPGIPVHERTHVFGRFARGERVRLEGLPGTGLGLALVAEHARLHGGGARVDDAPGGGARVVIELPVGELPVVEPDP